jgi:hypothetical protein
MQEILDALGPLANANIGTMLTVMWGPSLALGFIVIWRFYGERNALPRELVVVVIGMFAAMCFLPLVVIWQSFEALSLENWAKLTAVQVAAALFLVLVAVKALEGAKSQTSHNFAADWKRRRHIMIVVLPLAGLLMAGLSTRSFITYLTADTAMATTVEYIVSADGRQTLVKAEWEAPGGKKIPVSLAFDHMHAFRPKPAPGMKLPFRLDAKAVTAGKADPFYFVDMGFVTRLLNYLSTAVFGFAALLAGIMMRREKAA